jgi:hypothetical protein
MGAALTVQPCRVHMAVRKLTVAVTGSGTSIWARWWLLSVEESKASKDPGGSGRSAGSQGTTGVVTGAPWHVVVVVGGGPAAVVLGAVVPERTTVVGAVDTGLPDEEQAPAVRASASTVRTLPAPRHRCMQR